MVFVFLWFQPHLGVGDPDVAWHVHAGLTSSFSQLAERINAWSFTAPSQEWINLSWLPDLLLGALYHYFNLGGLILFTVAIYTFFHLWVFLRAQKLGASLFLSIGLSLLSVFELYSFVSARPTWITLFGTAVFVSLFEVLRSRSWNKREWLGVLLLWLVWINGHGGFLMGFGIAGIFFLDGIFSKNRQLAQRSFLAGDALFLFSLLNPLGLRIYYGASLTLNTAAQFSEEGIVEWQRFNPAHQPILFTVFLFVSFLWVKSFKNSEIKWSDRGLALVALIYPWSAIRYELLFIPLALPFLVKSLSQFKIPDHWTQKLEKTNQGRSAWAISIAVVLFLVGVSFSEVVNWDQNTRAFPYRPMKYLIEHYPDRNFFTPYHWGGWVSLFSGGKTKVFIDGRGYTAYPKSVVEQFFSMKTSPQGMEAGLNTSPEINGIAIWENSSEYEFVRGLKGWREDAKVGDLHFFLKDSATEKDHRPADH